MYKYYVSLFKLTSEEVKCLINKDKAFFDKKLSDLRFDLFNHFKETGFFSYIPEVYSRRYNWRQAFAVPYSLQDYVKGKHLCHIGAAYGDLELIFSRYAKEITAIEYHCGPYGHLTGRAKDGKYFCPVNGILGDFFDMSIDADVYFFWVDERVQDSFYEHILKSKRGDKEKIIISPCFEILYEDDINNYDESAEYYLIPFDENLDLSFYSLLLKVVEVAGFEPASAINPKLSHSQACLIYYHKSEKIDS